jgi:hypothetical protein
MTPSSSPERTRILSRLFVPRPKKAFQSPGTHRGTLGRFAELLII